MIKQKSLKFKVAQNSTGFTQILGKRKLQFMFWEFYASNLDYFFSGLYKTLVFPMKNSEGNLHPHSQSLSISLSLPAKNTCNTPTFFILRIKENISVHNKNH